MKRKRKTQTILCPGATSLLQSKGLIEKYAITELPFKLLFENEGKCDVFHMKTIFWSLEQVSYDLEMKTREQNKNNKRAEIKRFDWFIERLQTHLWLVKRTLG